jgi:endoribonuclease Dicer
MLLPERLASVLKVEEIFKYKFKNPCLAVEALTHPSSQDKSVQCYQRLEFLGNLLYIICMCLVLMYQSRRCSVGFLGC